MATALTVAKFTHGYRKQTVPKPPVLPACKNCRHLVYSAASISGSLRGELIFRKSYQRCILLNIRVLANCICNEHGFKHANGRDVQP